MRNTNCVLVSVLIVSAAVVGCAPAGGDLHGTGGSSGVAGQAGDGSGAGGNGSGGPSGSGAAGSGGVAGSGGMADRGGATGSGGAGTGGATSTGGSSGTGGSVGSGGTGTSGSSTGGAGGAGTGGSSGRGGAGSGGSSATGGAGKGGASGTGGSSTAGSSGTGGAAGFLDAKETELKAFPTAEGYGRYSKGGRAGKVVEVTNLNDSGAGSLRAAVEMTGARTIVFTVGGVIALKSKLLITGSLNNSTVTVAGQTAPGKGIAIRNFAFGMTGGADVIACASFASRSAAPR